MFPRDGTTKFGEDFTRFGGSPASARKRITLIHAVDLRLRDLIRTSRFLNEVCVELGDCLFKQAG
jgi:hypothetical protein